MAPLLLLTLCDVALASLGIHLPAGEMVPNVHTSCQPPCTFYYTLVTDGNLWHVRPQGGSLCPCDLVEVLFNPFV